MDHHEHHGHRPDKNGEKTPIKLGNFFKLAQKAKPKYWLMILGTLFMAGGTIANLIIPKMVSGLVNSFQKGSVDYSTLGIIVIILLISALLSMIGGTILGFFGEDVVAKLRKLVWGKLVKLPVKYFDEVKSGEMSSRLTNDTTQIKQLLSSEIPMVLSSIITIVGAVSIMLMTDFQMTLVIIIGIPVTLLIIIPIAMISGKIGYARQDALSDFSGTTTESLSEVRLVKSSTAETQAIAKGDNNIDALYKIGRRQAIFDSAMQPIMMLLMMTLIFGTLVYGVYRVSIGQSTFGTLLSFMMYMFSLMGAAPMLAQLFSVLASTAGSTQRISDILNEKEEVLDKGIEVDVEGQVLKADKISFGYEKGQQILTDVSFEAKPNQVIAFAGPSGGGKSTIISIIERFYKPQSGKLTIGKQDIQKISLQNWRAQIGLVSQDSPILAGTIRENLVYGLEGEYSDQQLWDVLELAYADKFVKEMDEQLDTQVGERGAKVSGGQRQRLAIARAFLRDPKILMLDEATASLDSESEAMVQKALESLMSNRTTIVIAHRLSTIVDADQIYFVDHGKITGHGTHKQLVKKHKLYQEYVANQFNQD